MKTYIVLLFIYIILLIIFTISNNSFYKKMQMEYFTNDVNQVDFYIISLRSLDRLVNIETQNKKLNAKINIIDAVNGLNINQNELLENKTLELGFSDINNIKRSKEIGCYMSHDKIFRKVLKVEFKLYRIVWL